MKVTVIAGARPNFIKIAPIIHSFINENICYRLVHTGQHYDKKMSDTFFKELEIPKPHVNLNCGGGSQAEQTSSIMLAFEEDLLKFPCDIVLVVGDVNSTMACSIVAKKLNIKLAHVEAGIRSGDRDMPEEINRLITDSITDYFFTTTELASENLLNEGHKDKNIYFVGNVMIDTLLRNKKKFSKPNFFDNLNLSKKNYFVMTMHRPSNVDEMHILIKLLKTIDDNVSDYPVIFPIHPRTKSILLKASCKFTNIKIVEPIGYLGFNYLVANSAGVLTDSGGITEETTVLKIPCITLRENTERPETITLGTNILVGNNHALLANCIKKIISGSWKNGIIPKLWDGKSAGRISKVLKMIINE